MNKLPAKYEDILKYICEKRDTFDNENLRFQKVIENELNDFIISYDTDNEYKIIFYTPGRDTKIEEVVKIMDTILFIKYLEDNQYIYIMHQKKLENSTIIYNNTKHKLKECEIFDSVMINIGGEKYIPLKSSQGKIYNTNFGKIVERYDKAIIFPSQILVEYVANGCKTTEQCRYESERCRTRIGIVVAIITGLGSLILNAVALLRDTTLNPTQLTEIKEEIKAVKTEFPSEVNIQKNDTIQVHITNKALKIK